MPKLSVWLVRASLVHMGIGFLFGSLILHHKGIPLYGWTWQLLGPHIEMMIFGWTMQFVMGVAFYILPRFSDRDSRYGRVRLGWWSFALLNLGVSVTAVGAWFNVLPWMLAGRVIVLVAVALFVTMIWERVKPLGGAARSS